MISIAVITVHYDFEDLWKRTVDLIKGLNFLDRSSDLQWSEIISSVSKKRGKIQRYGS